MRFSIPFATGALALGLVVATGRPVVAQDVIPPVSQDTSKAEKVRVDTVDVGQPAGAQGNVTAKDAQGYRAMGSPENCVPAGTPTDLAAPGDTVVTPIADTAAVAVAAPDSAARKAAEAAGIYPAVAAAKPCIPADSAARHKLDKPIDKGVEKDGMVKPDGSAKPDGAVKSDSASAGPQTR